MDYHLLRASSLIGTALAVLVAATPLQAEVALPPEARAFADQFRPKLADLLRADPDLSGRLAAGGASIDWSQLRYDFDRAFEMQRVTGNGLRSAPSADAAVVPTGNYYVPVCVGDRCGLLAGFHPTDQGWALVSAGHGQTYEDWRKTGAALETDPQWSPVPGKTLIQYPEAHANLTLVEDRVTHEHYFLPQSPQTVAALVTLLGRAPARPGVFSLAEMRAVSQRVAAHHAEEQPPQSAPAAGSPTEPQAMPPQPVTPAAPVEKAPAEIPVGLEAVRARPWAWLALGLIAVVGLFGLARRPR